MPPPWSSATPTTPGGRRRNVNGTDDPACSLTSITTRGFTGHEHMPAICEINANARIYEPTIGRFLSVDPLLQNPFDGQDYDGYGYVENNPLSTTDPTGMYPCGSVVIDPVTHLETVTVCPPLGPGTIPNPEPTGGSPIGHPPTLGGGGSSGAKPTSPTKKPMPLCKPSPAQLANSGPVSFTFSQFGVSALLTGGDAFGTYTTTGGYSGVFHTSFDGVFIGSPGFSVDYGKGSSQSLATFSGPNYNLIGTLGPYSLSDNFDPDSGEHIGQTDEFSTLGLGLGITDSNTQLVTISCPR